MGTMGSPEISKQDIPPVEGRVWKGRYSIAPLLILAFVMAVFGRTAVGFPSSPHHSRHLQEESVSVAFIGNSMFYFNDFPRFFQALSVPNVTQNSCLHGGGTISSLVEEGNAMHPHFATPNAILTEIDGHSIYDYGACTVAQLLKGTKARLVADQADADQNPCVRDPIYLDYAKQYFANLRPDWDYVLINDNTKGPARAKTRARSLEMLELFYLPYFQQSNATPVFLWTHAYFMDDDATSRSEQDMVGLDDVANFTSLTYVGIKEYAKFLRKRLPSSQKPRIAPVGMAFLLVYEEAPEVWRQLFHSDRLHASPAGTFLQGCIVHHTLFGELPPQDEAIREDMDRHWTRARMMQPASEPPNPFPTAEMASYLYHVAERIMVDGEVPQTFVRYRQKEVAFEG